MPANVRTRTGFKRRHRRFVRGGRRPVRRYQLGKALRRFARRIPRPQTKYLDANWGNVIPAWTATSYVNGPYSLAEQAALLTTTSSITQGVTQNTIIGYKGMWKNLRVQLSLAYNNTGANNLPQFVRIIHFLWKPNAVTDMSSNNTPQVGQILQDGNQVSSVPGFGSVGSYLSPYNKEWAQQYKILDDTRFVLTLNGWNNGQLIKFSKRLNKVFQTLQPGGQYTGLYSNQPYVLFISNQSVVADQPIINYYSRLTYTSF